MVLVIRFSISENWVSREIDAELGSPAYLRIWVRTQQGLSILVFLLVKLGEPLHRNDNLEFRLAIRSSSLSNLSVLPPNNSSRMISRSERRV